MTGLFKVQYGIPRPPDPRGRKKGRRNSDFELKQAIINRGINLVKLGKTYAQAAREVHPDYSHVTVLYLARLISQTCKNQTQV